MRATRGSCDESIVQVTGVTNPLGLGFEAMAIVGVRTTGAPEEVADELEGWEEASYVVVTAGRFDLLVELVCATGGTCSRSPTGSARSTGVALDRELRVPRAPQAALRLGHAGATPHRSTRARDRRVSVADAPGPAAPREHGAPLEKGLKTGALGFVSSVVIGVASTAPGYSLAASLGIVAAAGRVPGAGGAAGRVHSDVPDRRLVLLDEPGRSGLWDDVHLGDEGHRARARAGSPAGRCCSPTSS